MEEGIQHGAAAPGYRLPEPGAYRVCVKTRFSCVENKRDYYDRLQNSDVSIFAQWPVREFTELALLI